MALKTLKKKPNKKALGRGLSALISTQAVPVFRGKENLPVDGRSSKRPLATVSGGKSQSAPPYAASQDSDLDHEVHYLPLEQVTPNPFQPRKEFDPLELQELCSSIKTHGVLQPVIVRPSQEKDGKQYEIVAGERRWRAANLAEISQLPVIIKSITDKEALEVALIENVQRSNLNPIEEARAYQTLADEFSLNQAQIAERVGKDRASVSNYLRLLKLPPEVIEYLQNGKLSMGHAKAILTVKEPVAQLSLAKRCVVEGLSVRAVEDIVSRVVVLDTPKRNSVPRHNGGEGAALVSELNDRLRNSLGTKVAIQHHRSGKGKIEILYFSEQELERLIDHICR